MEVKLDRREDSMEVCAEAGDVYRSYEGIAQMAIRVSYKVGKYEERLNRLRDKLNALKERALRF